MKKKDNWSRDWFLQKGYIPNAHGGFDPPPVKSEYIKSPRESGQYVIAKEPVSNTPDFEYKPVTEWFIPYSVPSKKNSKQAFVKNGKQIVIPSKAHAEYVKVTKNYYSTFGKEFKRSVEVMDLKYPLHVEFTFIRATKIRADFTNCADTVQDLMKDNEWIIDDDMEHLIPHFQPRINDKSNPGVKIKLLLP
jgi:hypothetical protein